MTDGLFEFVAGQSPRSVRIIFRGFWDDAALQGYLAALQQRAAAASAGAPRIDRVLLDIKACTVQSQPVIDGFARIIGNYAGQIREYGVLLPESALLRLQMKRLTPVSTRFFEEEREALTWLDS